MTSWLRSLSLVRKFSQFENKMSFGGYQQGGMGGQGDNGGGRQMDPERSARSVYVVEIVYDRESGRSKGFGFCEFSSSEMADYAVTTMNGVEIHGRRLRVDRSR
uniref:RRM domain-containing protein n=1 Tax=Romanomermis culicivorax TaxID=13658 RepID=A0A915L0Q7_ROMCU